MVVKGNWENKAEARSEALRRMQEISSADAALKAPLRASSNHEFLNARLNQQLELFLKFQRGQWGGYRPMPQEASPTPSIGSSSHLRWAFPRVSGDFLTYFFEPKAWIQGALGIEEPDPSSSVFVEMQSLDGVLVPGLAFDRSGTRLGRGKGYFDRALAHFKGLKVGVAFEAQFFDGLLPRETHDVPMDVVVTERGTIFIRREGDRNND